MAHRTYAYIVRSWKDAQGSAPSHYATAVDLECPTNASSTEGEILEGGLWGAALIYESIHRTDKN